MISKDDQTLAPTKKEMANWIERCPPEVYACKLHQLGVTIAEALFIMSDVAEMGWRYQERTVREMVKLER